MSKKIEISTLSLLFIFTIYCTLTTGSFWDEPYEMTMGKDRLKYLFSFGSYEYLHHYQHTEFYPAFYGYSPTIGGSFAVICANRAININYISHFY